MNVIKSILECIIKGVKVILKTKLMMFLKEIYYGAYVRDEVWLYSEAGESIKESIENGRKYDTNIENIVDGKCFHTIVREKKIEEILDSGKYRINKPLLIKNPFSINNLICLIIFNTDEKCFVRYTVSSNKIKDSYTYKTDIYDERHRVAVTGLVEKSINKIKLELLDSTGEIIKTKNISVYIGKTPIEYKDYGNVIKEGDERTSEFFFLSGGYHTGVRVLDKYGNLRSALLSLPHAYGVYALSEGDFLFSSHGMRRPMFGNAHSVGMVSSDIMGRAYKAYLDEKGFHHWATETDDGFIGLSSSLYDTHMENSLRYIDGITGELKEEINLDDYFDDKFKIRPDWIHVNAVQYISDENAVIVCMRNIHSVAKINLDTRQMEWILANKKFYKGTKEEEKVLIPEDGSHVEWFYQQHGACVIDNLKKREEGRLYIGLFDNHVINRRKVEWFDGDNNSYICIYSIDEKNKTFRFEKRFKVPLSKTRSNFYYDDKTNTIYAFAAVVGTEDDEWRSKIMQFDYETGELIYEMDVHHDYFTGYPFEFNVNKLSNGLNNDKVEMLGELYGYSGVKGIQKNNLMRKIEDAPVTGKDFFYERAKKGTHHIRVYADILQVYGRDHEIEKIFLYNDNDMFMQDFEDSEQKMEVFKKQHYFVSMHLKGIKAGKYKIALKCDGNIMKTPYYITLY